MVRLYTVPEDLRELFVRDAWTIKFAAKLFTGQLKLDAAFNPVASSGLEPKPQPKARKSAANQKTKSTAGTIDNTQKSPASSVSPGQAKTPKTTLAKTPKSTLAKTPKTTLVKTPKTTLAKTPVKSSTTRKTPAQTNSKTTNQSVRAETRRYMALYADELDSELTTPTKTRASSLPDMSSDNEVDFPDRLSSPVKGKGSSSQSN